MTKLPVPPEPVLTRWNSWLKAVFFIFEHHDKIKQFLATLNSEESIAVGTAKTISEDGDLKKELMFIAGNFRPICTAITQLQERISLVRAFDIMESVRQCLTCLSPYEEKFNAVKAKNPAFDTIFDYNHILKGDQFEVATDTPEDAVLF